MLFFVGLFIRSNYKLNKHPNMFFAYSYLFLGALEFMSFIDYELKYV